MKNIYIVIQSLSAGGAEKQACLLAKELSSKYNTFLIISNQGLEDQKNLLIIKNSDVRIIKLEGGLLRKILTFRKILIVGQPSETVIFSYLMWGNLVSAIAAVLAGVKHRIGGIRNAYLPKLKFLVGRFTHNHLSSRTIFNNYNGFLRYSAKGFKKQTCLFIPNCINIPDEVIREQNSVVKVLSVGRFVPQKDYSTAVKTISSLKNLNFKYQIVGYGVLEDEIRREVKDLGLQDIVEIIINPPNIKEYYQSADIYFQTSLFEGLSNTVLEAMSFSLPCVVTDVGDNINLIENEKGGFVVFPQDEKYMADALSTLIMDDKKRDSYGRFNYLQVNDKYSVNSFKQRYLDLIDSLES